MKTYIMKILSLLFLLISIKLFGQNKMGIIQERHYTFCHRDLKAIERIAAYPNFAVEDLCSIKSCFRSIGHDEINKVVHLRLIEIAAINFNYGKFICLISGTKSIERADNENLNVEDDNGFIYVSIDDFINASEISKAQDIYNDETIRLIKNKR
jgi:hypothetical protein